MRQLLHRDRTISASVVVSVLALAIGCLALPAAAARAAGPPSVHITAPVAPVTVGSDVETQFTCTAAAGTSITSCVDENGEESPAYLNTDAIGTFTYTVTATASDGQTATGSITYTVTGGSKGGSLVNTRPPTISGTPKVGSVLTATPGTWSATPTTIHYLWQRCTTECIDIEGADASTYTVTAADVGAKLRVSVFVLAGRARGSAISAPVGPVPRGGQVGPTGPTTAKIKATLLKQLAPYGKAARLATVLRNHGYAYDCTALTRGTMTISWYQVPKGAHLSRTAKPVLIATGRRSFTRAGHARMTIKLTKAGTSLLKRSRQVKLSAKATFARTGAAQVSAIKAFTLKR